jgi:phosphoribosylanthranilate isomerase
MVDTRTARVRVKVCGITSVRDAHEAVEAGAQALGFVFYRASPRCVSPRRARAIIRQVPAHVLKVGVFVDAEPGEVRRIARWCALDAVQFHGQETPDYCARFKEYKTIKAFCVRTRDDLKGVAAYRVWGVLFDSRAGSRRGGTGKAFDWRILKGLKPAPRRLFLAGGLNVRTVGEAIRMVHPDWIDASSSLESAPGKKDAAKVREFISAVKKRRNR